MSEEAVVYRLEAIDKISDILEQIKGMDGDIRDGMGKTVDRIKDMTPPVARKASEWKRVRPPIINAAAAVVRVHDRITQLGRRATSVLSGIRQRLGTVGSALVGVFAVRTVMRFGQSLVDTLSTFERMETVLRSTLGSDSAARKVLEDIKQFTHGTPYEIENVTQAWVDMANRGFRPNMQQMTNLGDLAAATGRDLNGLTNAMMQAEAGMHRQLREFGIEVEQNGDKLSVAFRGQRRDIDNTRSALREYILSLGQIEGVAGTLAELDARTGGLLGNLKYELEQFKLQLAEGMKPVFDGLIGFARNLVGRLSELVTWVQANWETVMRWGKGVLYVAGAFTSLLLISKGILGIASMIKTVQTAFLLMNKVLGISKIAMMAFNVVASLNPIGIVIMAAAAAITFLILKFDTIRDFLVRMGKFLLKNHPFVFLINLIDKVIPGFKDALKRAFDWAVEKIFKPVANFIKRLFRIKPDLPEGVNIPRGATRPGRSQLGKGALDDVDPYGTTMPDDDDKRSKITDSMKSVTGGTGNIKHITVNIATMVENLVVKTETLLSPGQVKSEISRILLTAVNDVNYSN